MCSYQTFSCDRNLPFLTLCRNIRPYEYYVTGMDYKRALEYALDMKPHEQPVTAISRRSSAEEDSSFLNESTESGKFGERQLQIRP